MKISVSFTSHHPGVDPRIAVRHAVERARAANHAGLDAIFVGDKHITAQTYLQNTPFLGRLLAEWDERPAGCLFLFPLWNPVLIAEQVATLAAIAAGRFIVQTGIGGTNEYPAMGMNPRTRPSAFEEGLAIVRGLLAGDTVSSGGRFTIAGAHVAPMPAEPVEFWIGASAEVGIERAARLGDGWIAAPYLDLQSARTQLRVYTDALAQHSTTSAATALRRDVYVAATHQDAQRVQEHVVATGYRGIPPDALAIGTVSEVTDIFASYAQLGYTDIVIRHVVNDQPMVLASYERLGEVRSKLVGT